MWTSRILKRLSPLACSNTCAIRLSFLCANVAIIVFSGTGSTHPKFQSTVSSLLTSYLREICQLLAVLCGRRFKMNWQGQNNPRLVKNPTRISFELNASRDGEDNIPLKGTPQNVSPSMIHPLRHR